MPGQPGSCVMTASSVESPSFILSPKCAAVIHVFNLSASILAPQMARSKYHN